MTTRMLSLVPALYLAVLTAGCGGGGSPTGPGPTPKSVTLTLNFSSIEVIEDCDGIEGDGDFDFEVLASTPDAVTIVDRETITLGPGGRSRSLGRQSFTMDAGENTHVVVSFRATELDKNILGTVYADARLNHVLGSIDHVYSNGMWSHLGPQSISLGSSGCRVRLDWTADGA